MRIEIDIQAQTLSVLKAGEKVKNFFVSTGKNGPGQKSGSGCTPTGLHYVRARIGAGLPEASVLVSRRPTGEIYTAGLGALEPQRDWILTRILWLCGKEVGINRMGEVDTMRRYIYIHGTPDCEPMGVPLSHGCIRMRNKEIIELFDFISGTSVVEVNLLNWKE
jgi:L,D-transpeptidase YbiS